MLQALDYDKVDALAAQFTDYAQKLDNADRIRLAGFLLGLVNAVQQYATISQEDLFHAKECTTLFQEVDDDDGMDPGYHLHIMLDDLAEEFDELADCMDQQEVEDARAVALAKLTDAEKELLGVA